MGVLKYETGKISKKGIIVIPKGVREHLNIEEGDKLEIVIHEQNAQFHVLKKQSILDVFGMIKSDKGIPPVSEIRHQIKEDIAKNIVAEGRESYE